jgi:peptidoglycan/LPS O-acetylase OafA/YrhL
MGELEHAAVATRPMDASGAAPGRITSGPLDVRSETTTTGLRRLGFIDGIRGLAAVYVVISHCWDTVFGRHLPADAHLRAATAWLGFGSYAVAMFIVVSGLSIGLAAWKGGLRWPGGTRTYLVRRVTRIWPPYVVAVLVSSLLAATILHGKDGSLYDGANNIRPWGVITHLFMVQDLHWAGPAGSTAFWSIPVEFNIYILFIGVLALVRWRRRSWVAVVVAAMLLSAAITYFPTAPLASRIAGLYPSLFALFVVGFMTSEAVAKRAVLADRSWYRYLFLLGGLAVLLSVGALRRWTPVSPINFLWLGVLYALAIGQIIRGRWRNIEKALSAPPAVWLGDSSYSLYLTHACVIEVVWRWLVVPSTDVTWVRLILELTFGLFASIAASRLFYRLVERPFLHRRSLLSDRTAVRNAVGLSS